MDGNFRQAGRGRFGGGKRLEGLELRAGRRRELGMGGIDKWPASQQGSESARRRVSESASQRGRAGRCAGLINGERGRLRESRISLPISSASRKLSPVRVLSRSCIADAGFAEHGTEPVGGRVPAGTDNLSVNARTRGIRQQGAQALLWPLQSPLLSFQSFDFIQLRLAMAYFSWR
jgi:hypothetical protein